MKRLYLSFAILALIACGDEDLSGGGGGSRKGDGGTARREGDPRKGDGGGSGELDGGSEPGDDAGPSAPDAGTGSDASVLADAGAGGGGDGGGDAANPGTGIQVSGSWTVTMTAAAATTCQPSAFEATISDVWTFSGANGATLAGNHLGPNALTRESGEDVWTLWGSESAIAIADLQLATGGGLSGLFTFFRDTCNVVYDVRGVKR